MDSEEVTKEKQNFDSLSSQWWAKNGKFSILHKINPLRIGYIVNQIKTNNKIKKPLLKNINIIDLGCGGGLVSEPLSRLGANVLGVDFIEQNIKIAQKHAIKEKLKIKYKLVDVKKIDIRKKYDVVIILEVIEHLDNWKKIIKKINILLKKNGIVIFSTINRNFLSRFFTIFIAENILKWVPKGTHDFKKFITPSELSDELKKNKFKILDITGLVFDPITKTWFLSKKKTRLNYFCTAKKIN